MEVTAAQFRSNCFKILEEIRIKHREIIITKRGKPVARLIPYTNEDNLDPLVGALLGAGITVGDLTEPLEDEWELDKDQKIIQYPHVTAVW